MFSFHHNCKDLRFQISNWNMIRSIILNPAVSSKVNTDEKFVYIYIFKQDSTLFLYYLNAHDQIFVS